ncbi:MAG: hypothetical protein JXA18_12350 [Chitinispirillaceae bacterium]|nr:hypothetical protein [Chitinispirillaceae bacterium]
MNTPSLIVTVCCIGLGLQCGNPFFPPTGMPAEQTSQRATPQGLLDQLIESYETQRIDLFIDLLPDDGSFQFFIAPDFFDEYKIKYQQLSEARDVRLQFIGQSEYYYYWTQDMEEERHKRLFSKGTSIEFTEKPTLASVREFTDGTDTLAELLVAGGKFEYTWYPDAYTIEVFIVEIAQQVFLINRDSENLWVIRKWYDFSSEAGQ